MVRECALSVRLSRAVEPLFSITFVQTKEAKNGYWHGEMVQPVERLWVHCAAGRRQRRIRPHLRGRARRPDLAQRGSSGRVRGGQQPRQAGGGESQNALTAQPSTA